MTGRFGIASGVVVVLLATATAIMPRALDRLYTPRNPVPSLVPETQRKLTAREEPAKKRRMSVRPLTGPYIVIDTHTNRLYWRTRESVIRTILCSTGSGAELVDSTTGRRWKFDTPKGVFRVASKAQDPWWRKPDWAFLEEGQPLPRTAAERLDPTAMGDYAIGFGDGYYIHGTLYQRLIGVAVTHGCVRLADDDLKFLYTQVQMGTPVVIF